MSENDGTMDILPIDDHEQQDSHLPDDHEQQDSHLPPLAMGVGDNGQPVYHLNSPLLRPDGSEVVAEEKSAHGGEQDADKTDSPLFHEHTQTLPSESLGAIYAETVDQRATKDEDP